MDKKIAASENESSQAEAKYTTHYLDLLTRFEGLKQTSSVTWLACCPAHNDRSPSLSIKDAGDRLLVKCFAGCDYREIIDAIGALPSDLFEKNRFDRRKMRDTHRVPWKDAVIVLRRETGILLVLASQLQKGKALSDHDFQRLAEAAKRIEQAWRACQ